MAWKLIAKLEKGLEFFLHFYSTRKKEENIIVLTEKCRLFKITILRITIKMCYSA